MTISKKKIPVSITITVYTDPTNFSPSESVCARVRLGKWWNSDRLEFFFFIFFDFGSKKRGNGGTKGIELHYYRSRRMKSWVLLINVGNCLLFVREIKIAIVTRSRLICIDDRPRIISLSVDSFNFRTHPSVWIYFLVISIIRQSYFVLINLFHIFVVSLIPFQSNSRKCFINLFGDAFLIMKKNTEKIFFYNFWIVFCYFIFCTRSLSLIFIFHWKKSIEKKNWKT